jgi:tetratricopeptide (TPR) repeat protein
MRTVITIWLGFIWVSLMSFGAISLADPEWLQEYARPGKDAETRVYKSYGDVLLHQGDYRLAIAQYQRALQLSPDRVSVMVNLAVACRLAGATDESRRILRHAATLPTNRAGLIEFNLGELAECEGHAELALAQYEKAIGTIVGQDLVHQKLGMIHLRAERYDDARTAFERIFAIQTDPSVPYFDMLRRALDVYENDTINLPIIDSLLAVGWTADEVERFDLELIRQLQAHDDEIAKTCNHLGLIEMRLRNFAGAGEHFQRSLAIWPRNNDAVRGLQLATTGIQEEGEALSRR